MPTPLERVSAAVRRRAESEEHFRAVLARARAAGFTLQEIGDAAGISKQGVHQLLAESRKRKRKER